MDEKPRTDIKVELLELRALWGVAGGDGGRERGALLWRSGELGVGRGVFRILGFLGCWWYTRSAPALRTRGMAALLILLPTKCE